ncbi:hypothetical protein [Psychromonas arctica]|uniref:hypothetical protein n=1 Tax=Psychromonas arctica TaxID=168275 RepID=UPI00042615AE|nr:hypothetical protein [Psychromonas arctica]
MCGNNDITLHANEGVEGVQLSSPGPGGAASVLASAQASAPFFAAEVKGAISVPSFYDNFDLENGQLTNQDLVDKIMNVIAKL